MKTQHLDEGERYFLEHDIHQCNHNGDANTENEVFSLPRHPVPTNALLRKFWVFSAIKLGVVKIRSKLSVLISAEAV